MGFVFNPTTGQLDLVGGGSSAGVSSLSKSGDTPLTGAVTLSEGANVTLTQVGNDIEIASTGSGGTPGGSNTQVQFNDSGSFGGDAGLTYIKGTDALTVAGQVNAGSANIVGQTTIDYSTPVLLMRNSSGATNGKNWVTAASTSHLIGVAYDDTVSSSNTWLDVNRSGISISSITLSTGSSTAALTLNSSQLATFGGHVAVEGVTSTGATGTGRFVFDTSPTLTTASLGSSTATTQTAADNSTKLATTAYVDNAVLGQNFKEAVGAATTANLVGTYSNGVSGVGATFTYTATGVDTIDGVSLTLGMRVLIKDQTTTFQNGLYTVTTAGAIGIVGILTRATDGDQSTDWKTGDSTFVTAGTTQSTTTWAYTGIDSPTMGSTAITFVQTAGQGSFTAGNGISITGNSIAIDTSVTVDKTTAQTLTNKTLTTPTIASFTNATHNHTNAAGGGQLIATTALSATGTPSATTFLRGDNTWSVPSGLGDVVGPASATDNAVARFDLTTGKLIQNSAFIVDDAGGWSTPSSGSVGGNLTVATNGTGGTNVTTNAGTQTLTNKTIAGATVTGAFTGTGAYVPVTLLDSGTSASASTFWRGDGTWATPAGGGTVTSVASGNGMNFTTITGTGTVTMGTPSTLTVATTNALTTTSHTHAITSSSTPGAAASLLATDSSGIIGSTGTRIVKGWFADLTVTNAIAGSITGNAATVTTNANLTGVITSSGNATSIASQTGTGTKFVVDTSPTITTPVINQFGTASGLGAAWSTWTPTWTNVTIGNATVTGRYIQMGKIVQASLVVVWGNSTSASGTIIFSLPVTSISYGGTAGVLPLGVGAAYDTAGSVYQSAAIWNSTTTARFNVYNASSTYATLANMTNTVPVTWNTTDEWHCTFTYEAA